MCTAGTANAMLDLPLDGGWSDLAEVVAVYGSVSAVEGVYVSDTGGELMCFGVVLADEVEESVCAALATVVSVVCIVALTSADMLKLVATCVVAVVGVGTTNDACVSCVDGVTEVVVVSGALARSTYT